MHIFHFFSFVNKTRTFMKAFFTRLCPWNTKKIFSLILSLCITSLWLFDFCLELLCNTKITILNNFVTVSERKKGIAKLYHNTVKCLVFQWLLDKGWSRKENLFSWLLTNYQNCFHCTIWTEDLSFFVFFSNFFHDVKFWIVLSKGSSQEYFFR